MKVRAKEINGQKYSGYYNLKRRQPGEVFDLIPLTRVLSDGKRITITPEHQLRDSKWLEAVGDGLPKAQKIQEPQNEVITADEVI